MSSLRIKFLKRKKILQEHVRIALEEQGKVRRFTAELDLSQYEFPSHAVVWLEAKTLLQTMRFKLGTVGALPPATPRDISQLRSERITFNVLVLDPTTARKYGNVETVRPINAQRAADAPSSLLPVDLSDDLDGLLWCIRFTEDDGEGHTDAPVLVFAREAAQNSAAGFVKDAGVRAMVMPAALRDVLTMVLIVDEHEFAEESLGWRDAWLRFASGLAGGPPPAPDEERFFDEALAWIGKAVSQLASKADLLTAFVQERRA